MNGDLYEQTSEKFGICKVPGKFEASFPRIETRRQLLTSLSFPSPPSPFSVFFIRRVNSRPAENATQRYPLPRALREGSSSTSGRLASRSPRSRPPNPPSQHLHRLEVLLQVAPTVHPSRYDHREASSQLRRYGCRVELDGGRDGTRIRYDGASSRDVESLPEGFELEDDASDGA